MIFSIFLLIGQQLREEKGVDFDIENQLQNLTWTSINVTETTTAYERIVAVSLNGLPAVS